MATYRKTDHPALFADNLIDKHEALAPLADANICWIFKEYDPEAPGGRGRPANPNKIRPVCKVSCLSPIDRAMTDEAIDFKVVVDEKLWEELTPAGQAAAVDEALSQMGMNEDGAFKQDPTALLFAGTVERHGAYTERLTEFFQKQRSLFETAAQVAAQEEELQRETIAPIAS